MRRDSVYRAVGWFLLALAVRGAFLTSHRDRDWPYSIFYYVDSMAYYRYAEGLARGTRADAEVLYHPPLTGWFTWLQFRLWGLPPAPGWRYKLGFAFVNALTVALTYVYLRRWGFPGLAPWAALWLTFAFAMLEVSSTPNAETLYMLGLLLTLGTLLAGNARPGLTWGLLAGAVGGATSLARAEHLSLFVLLSAYLIFRAFRNRTGWSRPRRLWLVGLILGLLAPLVPWTLYTATVLHRINAQLQTIGAPPVRSWALITQYDAFNFAIANHPQADGGFDPALVPTAARTGRLSLADPAARLYYDAGYRLGWQWIREDPARFGRLVLRKVDRWLRGLSLGWGVSNWPGGLTGVRYPADAFVPDRRWLQWPLLACLGMGLLVGLRHFAPLGALLVIVVLHRLIVTVLFFGYARNLIAIYPVVVILSLWGGIALVRSLGRMLRISVSSRWTRWGWTVLMTVFTVHACLHFGALRNYMASGPVDERGKIIQDATVRIWLAPEARP
ncbi:MAG: glycosyltransferase family 39 protein [Acidobacteria bacterium]|nr:glycosyltransferase family 39 protein [Acidobacteriota bacterium]MDW7983974.1 glycosyltransferase family 39 protein [Acidobacteriota bacterium]